MVTEDSGTPAYRDASLSTARRVEDLVSRMTLPEKAAQLGSIRAGELLDDDGSLDRERAEALLADGIGQVTRLGGEGGLDPAGAAAVTNEVQSLLADTRLGVPAIPHEECLSGYMGPGGTTYPQAIGLASAWSPGLVEEITVEIRSQLEALGAAQALSPVLDLARDPRWGRTEETFGEDPYLAAAMACAYVSGLQGDGPEDGVAATAKHFAGHGASEGGKNRASVNVGPRELREVHLFPFEAAVREAGVESVMNAYHDIDGIPCASSAWLLTDVLRGEWGFDGIVVADYHSVRFLREEHGVARTDREAGVAALEAGLDVELPTTECYGGGLVDAVEAGELAEETVDGAVRRVLRTKVRKGVLDDPTVDADAAADAFETPDQRALARRAARESVILLKNEGDLLPLDGSESVAVLGPKADDAVGLLGDYAYAAHYAGTPEEMGIEVVTPRAAIVERLGEDAVTYAEGCTTTGPSTDGFDEAVTAAGEADVALAVVGARSAVEFTDADADARERPRVSTSGEGRDVADLDLPGVQADLVRAVAETDTPLAVVVVSGKPHSIEPIAEHVPAVAHAWLPGEEGGNGIADVLFGDHTPSGRLPVSIPRSVGQLPVYYSRKPNSHAKEHVYTPSAPRYPFGHGLSYTEFAYDDFELSADEVTPAGTVAAGVTVENVGDRAGHEVVQLYVRERNPDQARPVQELVGFERVRLDPGESRRVSFGVGAAQLAYHDEAMRLVVHPGEYELRVGRSSADVRGTATVEVVGGPERVPRSARRYFSDATVG